MCFFLLTQVNTSFAMIHVRTTGVTYPLWVSLGVKGWLPCTRTSSITLLAFAEIISGPSPWRSMISRRVCGAVRGICLLTMPQAHTSRQCFYRASFTCLYEPHRSWWRRTCFAPAVKTPFMGMMTRLTYGPKSMRHQTASGIWVAILNVWWPNCIHNVYRKCFEVALLLTQSQRQLEECWSCLPFASCSLWFLPSGSFSLVKS